MSRSRSENEHCFLQRQLAANRKQKQARKAYQEAELDALCTRWPQTNPHFEKARANYTAAGERATAYRQEWHAWRLGRDQDTVDA